MGDKSKGGGDAGGGGAKANDVFRDPFIRYLAYVGEIGRSLSTFSCPVSKNLSFFTGLTSTYILADTVRTGYMAFKDNQGAGKEDKKDDKKEDKDDKDDKKKKGKDQKKGKDDKKDEKEEKPSPPPGPKPIAAAFDRYTWHMLASLLIPSYTLGGVRNGVDRFMCFLKVPRPLRTYAVAFSALTLIPLIIRPIDMLSDHILDVSLRKIYSPPPPPSPPPKEEEDDKKDKKKKK